MLLDHTKNCTNIYLHLSQRKIEVSKFSWDQRDTGLNQSSMESIERHVDVHCLPLTSILLAAELTAVDLMTLNLKGQEFEVLQQMFYLQKIDVEVR
jgi:hypothetical protein